VGGVELVTADGARLSFEELRGRPVVLSLVYTSCYHVCSGLTLRLRETVKVAREALGADAFTVVTVGFDTPNDTPGRMQSYARERGAEQPGWYFASTDAATMERLATTVGFTYFPSPKGFDHITQTTIIDARGRVVLQVYGEDFAPPLVVEPLKKLVWGQNLDRRTIEGLVNTVKLFCTIYDPSSGRYRFDYSLIVNIAAGSLALGIALAGILAALRNVK
jgi:protein SCO1/2